MDERQYWYRATAPVSIPYWTEVVAYEAEMEDMPHPVPAAPMLFTSQEKAEAKLHYMESSDADAYLQAVEDYGEDLMNRAYENSPPLQVFSIGEWLLTEHLKDSDIHYVMIDGEVKTPADLLTELQGWHHQLSRGRGDPFYRERPETVPHYGPGSRGRHSDAHKG